MLQITASGDTKLWFGRIERPFSFQSPVMPEEFAAMLVVACEDVTFDERWSLSRELVQQGCRFAVCTGRDCSLWDDSIDFACVMDEVDGVSSSLVMSTWHDQEGLGEVAEFFAASTRFENWVPENFVALVIGGDSSYEVEVRAAVIKGFR